MSDDRVLRFVHIADTHINPDPSYTGMGTSVPPIACAHALVQQVNALPFEPDFVLHTGDVTYDPDPDAYNAAREVLGAIRWPVHYVAGNHDDGAALQRVMMGRAKPAPTLNYTVEIKGMQLVVVDSNGPAEPPAGFVDDAQLQWLSDLCTAADTRPLIIAVHHNVLPVGIPWLDTFMRMRNGEAFHRAILPARDRIRGVFFGHVHQNISTYRDGILYTSALSSWAQILTLPHSTDTEFDHGAEPGFNVVTVSPQQTFIRRHRYARPG